MLYTAVFGAQTNNRRRYTARSIAGLLLGAADCEKIYSPSMEAKTIDYQYCNEYNVTYY